MRTHGITFLLTLAVVFISLTGCILLEYGCLQNTIWQQLCYALFSASIITCVLSGVYYRIEKQRIKNKYFFHICFLYQKILNINILIKHRIMSSTSTEIMADKNITKTYELIQSNIQNIVEEIRPIEYWQFRSDKMQVVINMIKSNLQFLNSLGLDLLSAAILNNQWEKEKSNYPNSLPESIRNFVIQYDTRLSDIRGKSDTALVLLESAISVLMKSGKDKMQRLQTLKQEMEASARQFNNIP